MALVTCFMPVWPHERQHEGAFGGECERAALTCVWHVPAGIQNADIWIFEVLSQPTDGHQRRRRAGSHGSGCTSTSAVLAAEGALQLGAAQVCVSAQSNDDDSSRGVCINEHLRTRLSAPVSQIGSLSPG